MNRKAQSATEFVLLLSFMLLVFFVFFGILQQRISDITAKQDILYLQEANNVVLSELQLAEQVHADYTRTFSLDSLGDKSYSISFTDPYELTARFDDKSYVNFLSTPVGGELFLTKNNTLYKIDGLVRFPDGSIHDKSSAVAGMYMNVNPEMCYYYNYTNNCSGLRGLTSDAFMEACDDYYPCE